MIAEQRYQQILDLVAQRSSVTVQQLSEALDTSESTIRRDLIHLDQRRLLRRVHGGATAFRGQVQAKEEDMLTKQGQNMEAKRSMGRYAAGLISPEDFVYIDAGTSTLELVRAIAGEALEATYMTNGLPHARMLAAKGCRVYILPGRVKLTTEAIVGTNALDGLRGLNFTKAFLGTNGVSLEQGYTTPGLEEVRLKARALEASRESWMLADSSKLGKVFSAGICELGACPMITEHLPDPVYREHTIVKETEEL